MSKSSITEEGDRIIQSVLSDRELQIVDLVASGLTNQEIAEKLEISKRTVDNHISNILTKTSTSNRVELVRWALKWGKVCLDQVNCCTLPMPSDAAADAADKQ
jgi:DNA-binding NarL/FixJ family response regulator